MRYFPLDIGFEIHCTEAELLSFDWTTATAEFSIRDGADDATLRIVFQSDVIVRMIEEDALSTEDGSREAEGLVPYHFAYRVEGARFAEGLSEMWQMTHGPAKHFQFVTGGGCLDVLSASDPQFVVVPSATTDESS